jgi:hypothetical protein
MPVDDAVPSESSALYEIIHSPLIRGHLQSPLPPLSATDDPLHRLRVSVLLVCIPFDVYALEKRLESLSVQSKFVQELRVYSNIPDLLGLGVAQRHVTDPRRRRIAIGRGVRGGVERVPLLRLSCTLVTRVRSFQLEQEGSNLVVEDSRGHVIGVGVRGRQHRLHFWRLGGGAVCPWAT